MASFPVTVKGAPIRQPEGVNIPTLRTLDEFETISKEDRIFVLCFTASWCRPCHKMKPVILDIQKAYADTVRFFYVDVDESKDFTTSENISTLPTYVLFRGSKKIVVFSGADKDKLSAAVHIASAAAYAY